MDGHRRKCDGDDTRQSDIWSNRIIGRREYICMDDHQRYMSGIGGYGYDHAGCFPDTGERRSGSDSLFNHGDFSR